MNDKFHAVVVGSKVRKRLKCDSEFSCYYGSNVAMCSDGKCSLSSSVVYHGCEYLMQCSFELWAVVSCSMCVDFQLNAWLTSVILCCHMEQKVAGI